MQMDVRRRRGLSVVEVLVALIVLCVGLLGMAGTSALALRASTAAARERVAVSRVAARWAALAAEGCTGPISGSEASDPIQERWSVQSPRDGFSLVDIRAEWRSPRGRIDSLVVQSAFAC